MYKTLFCIIALFFTTFISAQGQIQGGNSANSTALLPEIVILFDQSSSVSKLKPKRVTKLWLQKLTESINIPFKVSFNGFDEDIYKYIEKTINHKSDLTPLENTINKMSLRGRATDMEPVFNYLLQNKVDESIFYIIIISDGQPEIWDKKLGYISRRVAADPRYAKLNKQRENLKKWGRSAKRLYNQFGSDYKRRNTELIDSLLPEIRDKLGSRIVFWDLSGNSKYIKKWVAATGARDLTKQQTSFDSNSKLFEDATRLLQERIESVRAQLQTEEITDDVPPSLTEFEDKQLEPIEIPGTSEGIKTAQLVGQEIVEEIVEEILPVVEEKPQIDIEKILPYMPEPASNPSPLVQQRNSNYLVYLISGLFVIFLTLLTSAYYKYYQKKKISVIKDSTAASAQKFIDKDVHNVIAEAEVKTEELLNKNKTVIAEESRLSIRFPIAPGMMNIYWRDREDNIQSGSAIDVSMHGVKFNCDNFNFDTIDRIDCPNLGISLKLSEAIIQCRHENTAIAVFKKFENGIDDKMKWVEVITRVNEE